MPGPVCVLHHHIGAESAFERGVGVTSSRDAYEAQIDALARDYNVIDLDTLLSGDLPPRALLMTFDDTFRSVLDVAREVLAPRGLPAVYFVNPGLLGRDAVSLDGALAWAANTVGLEPVCELLGVGQKPGIGALIKSLADRSARERAEIKAKLLETFGPPDLSERSPYLEPEDLVTLREHGVEIGNHTMTHVSCRALTEDELDEEIDAAKAKLEALSGAPVRSFSVPYGHENDLTPPVLERLRATGHKAIFLVHARANMQRPANDIWYRTSLHDEAPEKLTRLLRVAPALRTVKKLVVGWRSAGLVLTGLVSAAFGNVGAECACYELLAAFGGFDVDVGLAES